MGGWVAVLLVAMVANAFMEGLGIALLFPLLTMIGIGEGASHNPVAEHTRAVVAELELSIDVYGLLGIIIVVFALQYAVFLAQSFLAARLQHRLSAGWRQDLFRSYMGAAWRYFTEARSGELVNVVIGECNRISGAFYLLVQILSTAIVATIYVSISIAVSWEVTATLLGVALAVFLLTRALGSWARRIGLELSERNADLQHVTAEFVAAAKLVKASATEELAADRFGGIVERLRHLYFWSSFNPNIVRAIFEFAAIAAVCTWLVVATTWAQIDHVQILVILALFLRLYPRLSVLQQNIHALMVNGPAIHNANRVLAEAKKHAESINPSGASAIRRCDPVAIAIRGLRFRYGEAEVISEIDLDIPAGTIVGIIGPSGAGKTTLVDCLLRLSVPEAGTILVDGVDLNAQPLQNWRRSVGYVPQEAILLNASVKENILWGARDQSEGNLLSAAREAHAHEFIVAMADGYDTFVGDRGVRLSGGQRQRLVLARALARRPRLLVLDEAMSALDSEAELAVLDVLRSLHGRVTIVTVAHRLSTMRDADLIYVLDRGRVAEHGSWKNLVDRDSRFRHFLNLQRGGGTPDPVAEREEVGAKVSPDER